MIKKRHIILCFSVFCLTATLLVGVTSSVLPYDPWKDIDENGKINILDILGVAVMFGEEGTPINKTELLLGLQSRIDNLNATVEALKTTVQKGNISVPAAAFEPENRSHQLYGYNYIENHEDSAVRCIAPVQLPDGATVTNFTTYWYDAGIPNLLFYLTSYNSTLKWRDLAWGLSSGDTGDGSSYDDTIDFATVDNGKWAYILELTIPYSVSHTDYRFYYAVIEWEYPLP